MVIEVYSFFIEICSCESIYNVQIFLIPFAFLLENTAVEKSMICNTVL